MSDPAWTKADLAHIVSPASKLKEVLDGTKTYTKAICGTQIRKGMAETAPVCRACFDRFLDTVAEPAPEPAPAGGPVDTPAL